MAGLPASKTALLVEKRKQPCSKTRCPLHGCCYMGKFPLFGFCFHFDFAVFLFKVTDTLTDQVQNLPIAGTAFVLCNIVQFIVELRVDFDSQMLVVFVSHTITTKFPDSIIVKLFRKINKRRKTGLSAKITGGIRKNP